MQIEVSNELMRQVAGVTATVISAFMSIFLGWKAVAFANRVLVGRRARYTHFRQALKLLGEPGWTAETQGDESTLTHPSGVRLVTRGGGVAILGPVVTFPFSKREQRRLRDRIVELALTGKLNVKPTTSDYVNITNSSGKVIGGVDCDGKPFGTFAPVMVPTTEKSEATWARVKQAMSDAAKGATKPAPLETPVYLAEGGDMIGTIKTDVLGRSLLYRATDIPYFIVAENDCLFNTNGNHVGYVRLVNGRLLLYHDKSKA